MAWLGEKFRGDFRRWGCAWATATVLLIRADEERLRRKDFTQRGRRKGGEKSEKDRGADRGDAEGTERDNPSQGYGLRCGKLGRSKQRPYRVFLESRDGARAGLRLAPAILNAEARTSVRNIALGRQDQRARRACRAIQRAAQARPSGPWPVSMLLVISNLWRSMTATALSPARAT